MKREEAIKILKSKMDGSVDTSYEWAETVRMAIEALNCSEKPNGSLISRQDIKYHTQLEAMGNGRYEEVEVAYKNDIESLPSADRPTGWVPVSKRLPENSGRYIVTLKDNWAITVKVAVYGVMPHDTHNKKVFWLYDSCYDDLDITEDVVAWMPLPEPYKGGDSDG